MAAYDALLKETFSKGRSILSDQAVVYVRTDARRRTKDLTIDTLRGLFPEHAMHEVLRPFLKPTQTSLYGDKGSKPGEIDLVMIPRGAALGEDAMAMLGETSR